jgi:hypothetical protein
MKQLLGIALLVVYTSLALAQAPTQILIFQAFSQKNTLNPNLVVAQRYTGNCYRRSLAIPGRTDAWQCQASNMSFDPCFRDDTRLVCTISPWAHPVAILELASPLYGRSSKSNIDFKAEPWAIELQNGSKCSYLTGTSTMVNHQRVTYTCDNDPYNAVGKIYRSTSSWKVKVYDYNTKIIEVMAIKTAWF